MLIFFELPKKNRQIIIPLNDALTEYIKCKKYSTSIAVTSSGGGDAVIFIDTSDIAEIMGVSFTQIWGVDSGAWTGRYSQILTSSQILSQGRLVIQLYGMSYNQTYNIEVAVFYK